MAKTLVLGSNGFIGSHLVDSLVKNGHLVVAFDRPSSVKRLYRDNENIQFFPGDFLNLDDLGTALDGVEYVFHLVSTTTPASAENDPLIDIDTNIRGSVELFKLCVEKGVKKVIFASTGGAIYGYTGKINSYKETDVTRPVSPYAIGKLTIENYLRYFNVKHGLKSLILRISNPYGERQPFNRRQGVIPIFLENVYQDHPITILGDGSMERDYVYVKDVTNAVASIFDKDTHEDLYNIGSGAATNVNQLVDVVREVSQKEVKIQHKEVPATFMHRAVLDTSRYNNEFGELAKTSLRDGIEMTYEYIKGEFSKVNNGNK